MPNTRHPSFPGSDYLYQQRQAQKEKLLPALHQLVSDLSGVYQPVIGRNTDALLHLTRRNWIKAERHPEYLDAFVNNATQRNALIWHRVALRKAASLARSEGRWHRALRDCLYR